MEAYDRDALYWGLASLAANGITSCVDARAYWKRKSHEAWIESNDLGTMTVKAILSLWIYPEEVDDDAQIATLKGLYQNRA